MEVIVTAIEAVSVLIDDGEYQTSKLITFLDDLTIVYIVWIRAWKRLAWKLDAINDSSAVTFFFKLNCERISLVIARFA